MENEIIYSNSSSSSEADIIDEINKSKSKRDSITPTHSAKESAPVKSGDKIELPQIPEGYIVLSKKEQEAIVNLQVAKQIQGFQRQVMDLQSDLESQIKETNIEKDNLKREVQGLEKHLEIEQKRRESLIDAFNEVSPENPIGLSFIAPQSMRGGVSATDAWRECDRIFQESPIVHFIDSSTGTRYSHQDYRPVIAFSRKNPSIKDAIEEKLIKIGFLKGTSSFAGKDAPTTLSDVPPLIRAYLSETVRTTYSSRFILHQFPNRRIDQNVPLGQSIDVPRFQHLESGEEPEDWHLSPERDIVAVSQPAKAVSERIEIIDCGMGKDAKTPPVNIPEFILANSLVDLESILSVRIGYNYHKFIDRSIFRVLDKTKEIVYNNRNKVAVASELDQFTSGSNGQLTVDFVEELHAYAGALSLQPFEDGCYALCVPSLVIPQFSRDLRRNQQYTNVKSIEDLTNMFIRHTQNKEIDNVSGYVGSFSGFHVFVGNSFGIGAVSSIGTQEEVIGGEPQITRTALLMGPNAVGWASSMNMVLKEDMLRFNRGKEYIWESHEGIGALDIDPRSNPPFSLGQELRVIQVRLTQQLL